MSGSEFMRLLSETNPYSIWPFTLPDGTKIHVGEFLEFQTYEGGPFIQKQLKRYYPGSGAYALSAQREWGADRSERLYFKDGTFEDVTPIIRSTARKIPGFTSPAAAAAAAAAAAEAPAPTSVAPYVASFAPPVPAELDEWMFPPEDPYKRFYGGKRSLKKHVRKSRKHKAKKAKMSRKRRSS